MDSDKTDRISRRAYELWEAEGRPHGKHDDHWHAAERELDTDAAPEGGAPAAHPGMMGDGTEEQNLDQPGTPEARITAEEVEAAFKDSDKTL